LRKESGIIAPRSIEGVILDFRAGSEIIKEGAFLTTNKIEHSKMAQQFLSLTYSPRFRYNCIFKGKGINPDDKNDCYKLITTFKDYNRIWPAFGKMGGAREYILTEGTLDYDKSSEYKFKFGGTTDFFKQDNPQAYPLSSGMFLRFVYESFKDIKEEFEKIVKTLRAKITDSELILSWKGPKTRKFYSISCAYREFNQYFYKLFFVKFWGVVWEDNEKIGIRHLSKPVTDSAVFSKGDLENTDRLSQIIGGLVNYLSKTAKIKVDSSLLYDKIILPD